MADETSTNQNEVIVESNLHPYDAIKFGAALANVRNSIVFLVKRASESRQWRINLVSGTREDLLKAIEKAKGVTALD